MNRYRVFSICFSAAITAGFVLLAVFVFGDSYLRFGEACRDLGISAACYFCALFGIEHNLSPTVTEYSSVIGFPQLDLPSDVAEFISAAGDYFAMLFDPANLRGYIASVGGVLYGVIKIAVIALPCFIVFFIAMRLVYRRGNTKHGRDTLPLRVFRAAARYTYQPVKRALVSFRSFLRSHRYIPVCWAVLWAFSLNGGIGGHICAVQPLEEEGGFEQAAAFRGAQLRVYKRAANRFDGLRFYGQEKDYAHHGYDTLAGSNVPPEGVADTAKQRHEIPVLPVDKVRGRA